MSDAERIEEIRGVLSAQGRPMQAREIVAHCELVDGPTTCAQLLHRMARDGQVAIDERGHKRALYRLADQPKAPRQPKDLRPRSVRVRAWVAQQLEAFTVRQCADAVNAHEHTIRSMLDWMVKRGELQKVQATGQRKGGRVMYRRPHTDTTPAEKSQRQEAPSSATHEVADGERPSTGVPAGDRGQPHVEPGKAEPADPQPVKLPDEVRQWMDEHGKEVHPAEPGIESMLLTDQGHILIVGRNGDQIEILPVELRRLLILCDAAGHLMEGTTHASTCG